MLYLETDKDGDRVFLHADSEGIQKLRDVLDALEAQPEDAEHDHLMSPSWGGRELSETLTHGAKDSNSESNRTVHEVKL
jgi:immunity protein 32 of polymorphic toxin system